MPFTSKFSAEFAQGLLDRIQTVLESATIGPNAALAVIDGTLATFVDFTTPTRIALNFPCLYLEPDQSELQQSDDDSHIQGEHRFIISFAIVGNDAHTLKRRIVKYMRAVDQALRTMTAADLIGAVTNVKTKPAWEVTAHAYLGGQKLNETTYRDDASLLFVVQLLER